MTEEKVQTGSVSESYALQENLGSPAEYHNAAMRLRKLQGSRSAALDVLREGLAIYPHDVDLLADALLCAPTGNPNLWAREGDVNPRYAEDFFRLLLEEKDRWGWRAFDFSIDYLLDRKLSVMANEADVKGVKEEALFLSEQFTKQFPRTERSWTAYIKVLTESGNRDAAFNVLYSLIEEPDDDKKNIPLGQCCLRYADLLFEDGEYERAIRACKRGIQYLAMPQPSARVGYLVLLEALSYDALMHRDSIDGDSPEQAFGDRAKVGALFSLYETAYVLLDDRDYRDTILDRAAILACMSGFSVPDMLKKPE